MIAKLHHNHRRVVVGTECDPQGIVNYTNYFHWFDRNCERLFRDAGLSYSELLEHRHIDGIPLVEMNSKFLAPLRDGDEVEIESWVEDWNDKTFTVKHQAICGGEVVVESTETRAWVVRDEASPKGMKATTIPDEIKLQFAG
ncbi:MAG: acyl-CoA thioesterase [Rhodospirillales bacterium]|nr:acyl-CoA thioesterase [Rhodospirillales bacterium]